MTEKKIQEGIGKKIVEALKKQSEMELGSEVGEMEDISFIGDESDTTSFDSFANEETEEIALEDLDSIGEPQEISFMPDPEPVSVEKPEVLPDPDNIKIEPSWDFSTSAVEEKFVTPTIVPMKNIKPAQTVATVINVHNPRTFDLPPNVAVLRRLISQLPAGVSQPTGAQIIRQTMEALGISMNTVLHEAQKIQEGLNTSIKECSGTINEYKAQIKAFEKQAMDYQKQVGQLNELISLFILTEK